MAKDLMTEKKRGSFDTAIELASNWGLRIAGVMLLLIVLLNTYEVTARYAFDFPSAVMDEVLTYAHIGLIFLALPFVWRAGNHIAVDILPSWLQEPWKSRLRLFSLIMSFIAAISLTVLVLAFEQQLIVRWRRPDTALATPWAIPFVMVILGTTLFCIVVGASLVREIKSRRKQ